MARTNKNRNRQAIQKLLAPPAPDEDFTHRVAYQTARADLVKEIEVITGAIVPGFEQKMSQKIVTLIEIMIQESTP